jgi:hypothetical protein
MFFNDYNSLKDLPKTDGTWELRSTNGFKRYVSCVGSHCHNSFGPAIITLGSIQYFYKGKRHRLDGPATITDRGRQEWWINGERHREDGPAWIDNDIVIWFKHDKQHRDDGPAVEDSEGRKEWWNNDCLHRLDGPAVITNLLQEQYYFRDIRCETLKDVHIMYIQETFNVNKDAAAILLRLLRKF